MRDAFLSGSVTSGWWCSFFFRQGSRKTKKKKIRNAFKIITRVREGREKEMGKKKFVDSLNNFPGFFSGEIVRS